MKLLTIAKQLSLVIFLTASLAACQSAMGPKTHGFANNLIDGAPAGSPSFRYGWKDGCTSGIASSGSIHHQVMYDHTYDQTALYNIEYKTAWQLGYEQCQAQI